MSTFCDIPCCPELWKLGMGMAHFSCVTRLPSSPFFFALQMFRLFLSRLPQMLTSPLGSLVARATCLESSPEAANSRAPWSRDPWNKHGKILEIESFGDIPAMPKVSQTCASSHRRKRRPCHRNSLFPGRQPDKSRLRSRGALGFEPNSLEP